MELLIEGKKEKKKKELPNIEVVNRILNSSNEKQLKEK